MRARLLLTLLVWGVGGGGAAYAQGGPPTGEAPAEVATTDVAPAEAAAVPAPGDERPPDIGPDGAVVEPGANRRGDNRPGYDAFAPAAAPAPLPEGWEGDTPLPPGDSTVQGQVPLPAQTQAAGPLPKEGSGGDTNPQPADFTAPTIQGAGATTQSAAQATTTKAKAATTPALSTPSATSYWPLLLAVAVFAVILYASFWRVLMRRLDQVEATVEAAVRPLGDGGIHGARRLSHRQALKLMGVSTKEPAPLPSEGLSFGLAAPEQLSAVADVLVAAALRHCPGPVVLLSNRELEDVVRAWGQGAADPQAAAEQAQRLVVAPTHSQSVNSIARMLRRLTAGQGTLILEHPRWLVDLDGPARASWVLARLDERLSELAEGAGVAVWVLIAHGPLAPDPSAAGSAHIGAVLALDPQGGAVRRRGQVGEAAVDDSVAPEGA